MKKSLIVFFCVCISLTSCLFNKKVLYLKTENETGLKTGDDVRIKDCKIGTVDKVYLTKDFQSLVKINFDENTLIPIESRFTIDNTDLFSTKAIKIIPGKSKRYIPYGDTVQFIIEV
jgi:ABC-type transporter Mla subunit MlaD